MYGSEKEGKQEDTPGFPSVLAATSFAHRKML
jgi:hypothetical protein